LSSTFKAFIAGICGLVHSDFSNNTSENLSGVAGISQYDNDREKYAGFLYHIYVGIDWNQLCYNEFF
jgi:hypothetical protein